MKQFKHNDIVHFSNFSPDGTKIVTASNDKIARIFDAETTELLITLESHNDLIFSANYSPDGTKIVTASVDNTAKIWNSDSGELIHTLKGHNDCVFNAIFSPNNEKVATISYDTTVKTWDVKTGELLITIKSNEKNISSANFNSHGTKVILTTDNYTTEIWNIVTGELIHVDNNVLQIPNVFNESYIITLNNDKILRLLDIKTGKVLHTIILDSRILRILSICFSPNGLLMAIRAKLENKSTIVEIWNIENTDSVKLIKVLKNGHTDYISSVNFSPDSSKIVTSSWDKTAKIWDLSELE